MDSMKLMIDAYGDDVFSSLWANRINSLLNSEREAILFIHDQLDAAMKGNDFAKEFALNSGISFHEFDGATSDIHPEIDDPNGPNQTLINLCLVLQDECDTDQIVKISTQIIDRIMEIWNLGKYSTNDNNIKNIHENISNEATGTNEFYQEYEAVMKSDEITSIGLSSVVIKKSKSEHGVFVDIMNDIGAAAEAGTFDGEISLKMAYAYARRLSGAGLYLQGGWDYKEYEYVVDMFVKFQINTDGSKKFQLEAYEDSLKFIQTYNKDLNEEVSRRIIRAAQQKVFNGPGNPGELYTAEHIISIFK